MKLVKEYLNEKFQEESDPIHDMEIGLITQLKKEYAAENSYAWYNILPENVKLSDLMTFCLRKEKYGLDVIQALLDAGVDINDKDYSFLANAVYRGMDFVKFFLNKGAKPTADRSLALGNAIQHNNFDIAELLLSKGASIKAVGLEKLTAAVKDNDITLIKWLLDKGVNPNGYNYRALRFALKDKNYELADMFVKYYIKDRESK
jgi:ankyrin repeat protein